MPKTLIFKVTWTYQMSDAYQKSVLLRNWINIAWWHRTFFLNMNSQQISDILFDQYPSFNIKKLLNWMTYNTWKSVQFSLQIISKYVYFLKLCTTLSKLNQSNSQLFTKSSLKKSLKKMSINISSYVSNNISYHSSSLLFPFLFFFFFLNIII